MYDDAPQELVHDLIAEAVFGDHPLGRPVIGTAEVISSIPREAIARYHDAMYVPGNIVVAAAGTIEHDRVVELVTKGLERRNVTSGSRPNDRPPLAETPSPRLRFLQKDTEQYHVCLAAPGISRSDPRRFAASILDAILGGSASSRLLPAGALDASFASPRCSRLLSPPQSPVRQRLVAGSSKAGGIAAAGLGVMGLFGSLTNYSLFLAAVLAPPLPS